MTGRRPFKTLTKDFGPERRARVDSIKAELLAGIQEATSADLREEAMSIKLDQTEVASRD